MKDTQPSRGPLMGELKSSLAYLAFGVLVLAFLALTDRAAWFQLRPATGTAAALSYAAQPPNAASPARFSR